MSNSDYSKREIDSNVALDSAIIEHIQKWPVGAERTLQDCGLYRFGELTARAESAVAEIRSSTRPHRHPSLLMYRRVGALTARELRLYFQPRLPK